jgi:hypothetical protein
VSPGDTLRRSARRFPTIAPFAISRHDGSPWSIVTGSTASSDAGSTPWSVTRSRLLRQALTKRMTGRTACTPSTLAMALR